MPEPTDFRTRTKTFRISAEEEAEIDAHLQRVGGTQSEFFRNAILARARGTIDFAELMPSFAASMERQMAELARSVQSQTSGVQTLAAAAVASSAMLLDALDGGKTPRAQLAHHVEDQIKRAVSYAPQVVAQLPPQAHGSTAGWQRAR